METQALNAISATVKTGTGKVLVEKRDGRVVDFDPINIISAVKSAFADLDKKIGPQEEQLIRDIANQSKPKSRIVTTVPPRSKTSRISLSTV